MNKAVFDGTLTPPKSIEIRNFRDCLGWCQAAYKRDRTKVKLGIRRDMEDRKQFLTVLAHEMVHMYEQQVHGKMSHGQTFYEWAPRIKRCVGLDLSEYVE